MFIYYIRLGKPVTHQCPSGLKYNQDLRVCDWESNVAACAKETEGKAI